jgi:tRNA(Arg) A34 adenosine deaminase TadA
MLSKVSDIPCEWQSDTLSKGWKRGFDAARAASLLSNGSTPGYKLGAALYSGSTLLSIGHNVWGKTTPHSKRSDYEGNTHAEVMALVKRWHYDNPSNLIIYVSRTTMDNRRRYYSQGCSRPCANCLAVLTMAGVRRIRFFDEEGIAKEIKL